MNPSTRLRLSFLAKCSAALVVFAALRYSLVRSSTAGPGIDPNSFVPQPIPWGKLFARLPPPPPGASTPTLPVYSGDHTKCDVLVIGGTPSGIAAALAAARRGADVMLVESRPLLGGDIVYAMLNQFDVPARPGEASPVHGIFAEFYDQLGTAFSINHARHLFEDTVAIEPTLHAYSRTHVMRVLRDGNRVVGAVLRGEPVSGAKPIDTEVRAHVVIDATNDANVAVHAGAGFYLGRETANPDKAMQSAGLLFSITGVNWSALETYVHGERPIKIKVKVSSPTSPSAAPSTTTGLENAAYATPEKIVWLRLGGNHGNYIWERGDLTRHYKAHGPHVMLLSINFGRQPDGSVVLNTLNVVGVNGLDAQSIREGHREGVDELPYFIPYLRHVLPSAFKNVMLGRIAPELYIRETRHIKGFYSLKVADIRSQTRFPDRVAMVSYPLDLHPYKMGETNPYGARRYYYTLPLRCLVPHGVDGMFVASRSLSATYSAAGSARVIPITMAAGEAAGAAAWLCVRKNVTPSTLVGSPRLVGSVQHSLREWGADVGDKFPTSQGAPHLTRRRPLPPKIVPPTNARILRRIP